MYSLLRITSDPMVIQFTLCDIPLTEGVTITFQKSVIDNLKYSQIVCE